MINDPNLALFHLINGFAGNNSILDTSMVFAANYLIYIFGVYLIYLIYLLFVKNKYHQEVLFTGYAAFLGLGINLIITLFYFHPRPFMIPTGTLLIEHAPETSFPSDHTTLMFAISLMLISFRELRTTGAVFFILSFIGGFARVYAGLHFPMDIAGSLFVAVFSVYLLLIFKQYIIPINRRLIAYSEVVVNNLYGR